MTNYLNFVSLNLLIGIQWKEIWNLLDSLHIGIIYALAGFTCHVKQMPLSDPG